jgi:hypothetical protein
VIRQNQTYSALQFSSAWENGRVQQTGYRMKCQGKTNSAIFCLCSRALQQPRGCDAPLVSRGLPKAHIQFLFSLPTFGLFHTLLVVFWNFFCAHSPYFFIILDGYTQPPPLALRPHAISIPSKHTANQSSSPLSVHHLVP